MPNISADHQCLRKRTRYMDDVDGWKKQASERARAGSSGYAISSILGTRRALL